MKKYAHFSRFMVPVGLSASLCGASVQADTWTTPGNLRPKFKVEAVRFHCNNETGYDSPWFAPWISDEVRVGVKTDAATWPRQFSKTSTAASHGVSGPVKVAFSRSTGKAYSTGVGPAWRRALPGRSASRS
jgi:hypothetical protein